MPCILGRHCGPQVHGHAACFARAQPPKTRAPGTRSRTRRTHHPANPRPVESRPQCALRLVHAHLARPGQPVEPGLHQALAARPKGASSRWARRLRSRPTRWWFSSRTGACSSPRRLCSNHPRGSPSSGVPMLLCGGGGDRHQNCRGNAARNPMPAHSRTRASPLIAVWTARAVELERIRPANSRVDANDTVRSPSSSEFWLACSAGWCVPRRWREDRLPDRPWHACTPAWRTVRTVRPGCSAAWWPATRPSLA